MEEKQKIRGRFAPSPSGRMHLGNLFAALLVWLDVRSQGGEILFRMEDLDPQRCRSDYAEQLADDLRWLGLDWDLGWQAGEGAYTQSRRSAHYEAALRQLEEQARIYPCYCNRKERLAASAPHQTDGVGIYTGKCRNLTPEEEGSLQQQGRRPAWRVKVPPEEIAFHDDNFGAFTQNLHRDCGDFILRRSDGVYAYQLAVVVDDAQMDINRVVRGSDLLSSTPQQIWLRETLGYKAPSYGHTPLLTDHQGRRLSKRDEDLDVGLLRQNYTAEEITGFLAYTAGLVDKPQKLAPRELIKEFSWKKLGRENHVIQENALEQWKTRLRG